MSTYFYDILLVNRQVFRGRLFDIFIALMRVNYEVYFFVKLVRFD